MYLLVIITSFLRRNWFHSSQDNRRIKEIQKVIKNCSPNHSIYSNKFSLKLMKHCNEHVFLQYAYTLCHVKQFSKYGTDFLYANYLPFGIKNPILYSITREIHDWNEWIRPWLSEWKFYITWSPFLFLMETE